MMWGQECCECFTRVACERLNTHHTVHQVLFISSANSSAHLRICHSKDFLLHSCISVPERVRGHVRACDRASRSHSDSGKHVIACEHVCVACMPEFVFDFEAKFLLQGLLRGTFGGTVRFSFHSSVWIEFSLHWSTRRVSITKLS